MAGYFTAFARAFDFRGTTTRREFVWFMVVQIALYVAAAIAFSASQETQSIAISIIFVVHAVPTLAAEVRRLHDCGKSGYFVLLQLFPLMLPLMILVLMVRPSEQSSTASVAAPETDGTSTVVSRLSELAALRSAGALSEDEFARLKKRVLGWPDGGNV